MAKPILDDALWNTIEPQLPPSKHRRYWYPGCKPVGNREALTGILFMLKTGVPWEYLPKEMGCASNPFWQSAIQRTAEVWGVYRWVA